MTEELKTNHHRIIFSKRQPVYWTLATPCCPAALCFSGSSGIGMIMSAAQIWFCTPCTFCNGMYASTRAGWRSIVFMSQFHKKPENHGTLPVSSLRILQLVHRVPFFPCLDGPVVSAAMSLKDFYPDWDLERGVFGSGKLPKPLGPELQAFELEKKMTSKEILVWSFFRHLDGHCDGFLRVVLQKTSIHINHFGVFHLTRHRLWIKLLGPVDHPLKSTRSWVGIPTSWVGRRLGRSGQKSGVWQLVGCKTRWNTALLMVMNDYMYIIFISAIDIRSHISAHPHTHNIYIIIYNYIYVIYILYTYVTSNMYTDVQKIPWIYDIHWLSGCINTLGLKDGQPSSNHESIQKHT